MKKRVILTRRLCPNCGKDTLLFASDLSGNVVNISCEPCTFLLNYEELTGIENGQNALQSAWHFIQNSRYPEALSLPQGSVGS